VAFLTRAPLDLGALVTRVSAPARGGIACFLGVVRDHHDGRAVASLEYSAYDAMAEAECARVVAEARARWQADIALEHRLGHLDVGDAAVAIAAAAPHRDAAFAACRYVIEEVKRRVPIWKRERFVDGSEIWVGETRRGGAAEGQRGTVPEPSVSEQNEWGV
jgi:molybdopterin synthase catalytic subunit